MANLLDFRKLRYVVGVAQSHSMTAAAESLSITQPALTRCINEVEEELGVKLFVRLPRGMALTEEGQKFVTRARLLLSDLDTLGEDFRLESRRARRRLRLAVAPATYLSLIAPFLADFAAEHPDVDISTPGGQPQEMIRRLGRGEVDAVLSTSYYLHHWPDFEIENIGSLHFAYMVRKGHPIEQFDLPSEEEVLRYPAILPTTISWMHADMREQYAKLGLPPLRATYVTDDITLIFSLLNRTDAYFPILSLRDSMTEMAKDFTFISVNRKFNHYLYLAYSKKSSPSSLGRKLVPFIRDRISSSQEA